MAAAPGIGRSDMFDNPLFSDIKIHQTHKGVTKEYHAHKAVLCAASPWFHNLITNIYDGVSGVIEIRGDNADDFEAMLKFMYTLKLDHPHLLKSSDCIDCLFRIHSLAYKYQVRGLQVRCGEKCSLASDEEWDEIYDTDRVGDIIGDHYAVCSDQKCTFGRRICSYLLKNDPDTIKGAWCRDLLRDWPKFALDMLSEAIDNNGGRLY